jgi:TPR repeat protein
MPYHYKSHAESPKHRDGLCNSEIEDWLEKGTACHKAGIYSEAVNWYRKAAEQGNMEAQYHLGFCYLNGHGITNDDLMAFHWINKAARQGDGDSLCIMGTCYAAGWECLQRDIAEAYKFFTHAHAQGQKDAAGWLKALHDWASPQELEEGERRARKYRIEAT